MREVKQEGPFTPDDATLRLADAYGVRVTSQGTVLHDPDGAVSGSISLTTVTEWSFFYGRRVPKFRVSAQRGGRGTPLHGLRDKIVPRFTWLGDKNDQAVNDAIKKLVVWLTR